MNPEPTAAERANQNAPADRQGADVALREAKEAAEKAKADAEVARNGLEAANRDAQLAKAEAERLSAETMKLNAALERLETEKTAAETKAHTMESVAYGAVAILIAFLVSPFIADRRKVTIADRKRVGSETEPAQVLTVPQFSQQAGSHDSVSPAPSQYCNTASSSSEVTQGSTSDATIAINQSESGASATESRPDPNTAEGNVTTPSDKAHLEATASHG